LTHPRSPLRGADRIVSIFRQGHEAGQLSHNEYQLLKNRLDAFDWIGAARIAPSDITIRDHSEIAIVAAVTPNLAGALNLPLGAGVIISNHMWQSEFGGRADIIGSQIRVNNADLRINGVAKDQLEGLYRDRIVDLWVPLLVRSLPGTDRDRRDLWVLASLRRAVSTSQAQADVRRSLNSSSDVSVVPFTGATPTMVQGLSRIGALLNWTSGAVFFIACINVGSFLLGRALRRSHETSLRIALGATRAALIRELLSDSIVMSLAGGSVGVLLAVWTARVIPALLFQEDAERLVLAPHLLPIVTASMLTVGITVICGMMPVFATVTDRPWTILRRESELPSKTMERLRSGLVIGQITTCWVLVVCTALLLEGLRSALETGAGHRLGNPILVTVQAQAQPEVDIKFFSEVEQRAKSAANLSPLAWTARPPGSQAAWRSFKVQPPSLQRRDVEIDVAWFTPDSLKLFDNRPIAGRMFGLIDQTRRVAVVDELAAAELFGRDTIGMVIQDPSSLPVEIIGVVKRSSKYELQQERPTIYYDYMNHSDVPKPIRSAHFRVPLVSPLMNIQLNANVVSPRYFSAFDLPLIAGQVFAEHQVPGQDRVGVINQEAADLFFGGQLLGTGIIDERGVRTEIIGVVGSRVLGTFQQHEEPTIYLPMWQECPPRMTLVLERSKWNGRILADLRRRIESVPGHDLTPAIIEPLDTRLAQSAFAPLRIATLICGASASTGLILSILGLFNAQNEAERQRLRELALHVALGAQRWRIVFRVVRNAGRLVLLGTVTGSLVSLALVRLLIADTVSITSPPFWVWMIAPLLLVVVVVIASAIPAHRASHVDPLTIMRDNN
jgi:ABC-type antimicrobial peptide transport system permease subunit